MQAITARVNIITSQELYQVSTLIFTFVMEKMTFYVLSFRTHELIYAYVSFVSRT